MTNNCFKYHITMWQICIYVLLQTYLEWEVKLGIVLSNDIESYTLLGIAFECGFSSKASFNRVFKKETGVSPSDFRKSVVV